MIVVLAIVISFFHCLLRAVVIRDLWTWFAEPLVHYSAPSVAVITGLAFLYSTAFPGCDIYKRETDGAKATVWFLQPLIAWALGALLHSWGGQ